MTATTAVLAHSTLGSAESVTLITDSSSTADKQKCSTVTPVSQSVATSVSSSALSHPPLLDHSELRPRVESSPRSTNTLAIGSFSGSHLPSSSPDIAFDSLAFKKPTSWIHLLTKSGFGRDNGTSGSKHTKSLTTPTNTESCYSLASSVSSTTSNEHFNSNQLSPYQATTVTNNQGIVLKQSRSLSFPNRLSRDCSRHANNNSGCETGPARKGFFGKMMKITRNHALSTLLGKNSSSSRLHNNASSLSITTLNGSASDKENNISTLGINNPPMLQTGTHGSTSSAVASTLPVLLEPIISAIRSGNFLQLSDANLELLIRELTGKDSKVLETIKIKSAAISSTDAKLLAKLITSSSAANIKILKLDRSAISQDAIKRLFEALKVNETITELGMSRSGVNDKSIKYIAKSLTKNVALKELDLSNNRISSQGIEVLCEALISNQYLTRLCIQSNNIKAAGARHLATLLTKNRTIRHINVGSNGLGSEGCVMIANAVRFNTTLNSLSMDMNEMGPRGASAIALVISTNQALTHLYIPHNNIGDEGMTEICMSLKRNNSLIGLDVELNHIGHEQGIAGMKALAEALTVNTSLREINLSYNLLSSEAIHELAAGVGANSTLESILFTNCCMNTEGALAIANVLPSATGLQNLGLTSNPDIEVDGYWALATSLEKNRSMKGIQLDYNSMDRHVLYESIQKSLTRNFHWQLAVYRSACRLLALSRIVLLGHPSEQRLLLSQQLQQQQQGGAGSNILKRASLGRTFSADSQQALFSFGKNKPYDSALSNGSDGGDNINEGREGVQNLAHGNTPSQSTSFRGSDDSPLVRQISNSESSLMSQGLSGSTPSRLQSPPTSPSQQQSPLGYNAHSVLAHLGNMPYEIFETICAFIDSDRNLTIAQIRATIQAGGDRSTLSADYTKAKMLERVLRRRYIPSVGVRYNIKDEEERI